MARVLVSRGSTGARVLWALAMLCLGLGASASTLTREQLAAWFPAPLSVGERDPQLPVWPVFRRELTSQVLLGYVFESVDMAAVPGFSGTPVNLLVALDTKGQFLDVRVLSHHEPVFLDGLGEAPLFRFVEQYKGLSLQQNIRIGTAQDRSRAGGQASVTLDGVSKATASVRIINQSLLAASLQVARAKLGFAAGRDPDLIGRVRGETFQVLDADGLERAGLLVHRRWLNREVEAAFHGSVGAGLDERALAAPEEPYTELLVAHLNVPTVGRNLLDERAWRYLSGWLEPGDHAFLVATRGRASFVGDRYVTGAVPDRLTLQQDGLSVEIRDFPIDTQPQLPAHWRGPDVRWRVMKVISQASLDPSQALTWRLWVTRSKGQILAEHVHQPLALVARLPEAYVEQPRADDKTWHAIWRSRGAEIAVLAVALAALTFGLARPGLLVRSTRRLRALRLAYLACTLGFVGWYAQGQLSIVNVTALIQALLAGRSLAFFLHDPMTVLLWAYVGLTLVVWGRGTFCGWLCPYGALQEWVAVLARWLKLPAWHLHPRTDARLKRWKYAVLVVLVPVPLVSAPWTDRLVEFEPFKTSITLNFVRSWPYVAWAAGLVVLGAFVYKAWCRYLCPLGAGLAVLGRLRQWAWLPRRAECGQPCQTCRHRCEYQAISAAGAIDYAECFQCLDCVAIHDSDALCAPRILASRKGRTIAIHPLPLTGGAR